jgi:hypothetical protein
MNRIAKSEDELQFLRTLCDESTPRPHRLELLKSLEGHLFLAPEHQIVFESIGFLFPCGGVSAARLAVHLNNRGFPDVDVTIYFPGTSVNGTLEINDGKESA